MILFELKKIFESKLNIIAMIAGYLLIGVCAFSYISQTSYYDKKSDTYIYGIEAIHATQERASDQTDIISEEYITSLIQEIQSQNINLDSDEAFMKVIRPLGYIFYFVANNYTDMRANITESQNLNMIDLTNGAMFYEQRLKKVTDYLNLDFSYGNYSEAEKTYWIKKTKAVEVPFAWGDKTVMGIIWDIIAIGFYLLFVVVICISSIFSSEHESGAASLLLTTKYGKNRLITSKIITAMLFAICYIGIAFLVTAGVVGALLGFPGADLPVQLWNSVIPYELTVGQACMISFGIAMLICLAVTSVMLLCSARFKSSLATLVCGFVILIAPAFFPMSRSSGLWNHVNSLFPMRAMNVKEILGAFTSYTLNNHVISYLGMIVIVYSAVAVLSLLPIKKGFIRMK